MQQLDAAEGLPHYARSTVLGSPVSEDCLYLNVFTPAPDSALRPVMVWIHGGGLQTGSGDSWPFFEGTFLPDEVVLVTINYRLNIFLNCWQYPARGDCSRARLSSPEAPTQPFRSLRHASGPGWCWRQSGSAPEIG